MPKLQTDYLIELIRTLTKAEKRHFRLLVKRNQANEELLFLQLFDLLDKHKRYDEALILRKIPAIKKRQLSNLKAHLYKQLLLSLRLLYRPHNMDIEIRERLDYARVLYNKGLYRQSLEILDKAKVTARNVRLNALTLEILDFEKLIEGQYITRSIDTRAETLAEESKEEIMRVSRTHEFSNLSLQLYGLYLKMGLVRSREEKDFVHVFFQKNLPKYDLDELGFYEKLYLYKAYDWYSLMNQDFLLYYKYAQRWVDLFDEYPEMVKLQTPLFLKGLHNLLNSLFMVGRYDKFVEVLERLESFDVKNTDKPTNNIEGLFFLFKYIHRINLHFIAGTFSEGVNILPKLDQLLSDNPYNWDDHRILVFRYKIACMYFGGGDNERAIDYLNEIINRRQPDFREDTQCFARILNLIAHFELGNETLVTYQVKSVYRFLIKIEDLHEVQNEILKFLRKLPKIYEYELKDEFTKLRDTLIKLEKHPYEKRPFVYLDIISWLESKIEGRTVQEVIREKFLKRQGIKTINVTD